MPVQVTPYQGSRLTDIAFQAEGIKDRREGLRLRDIALQQQGTRDQFNQDATRARIGQAQQNLDLAAKQLGVSREQAEQRMLVETIKAAKASNETGDPAQTKQIAVAMYGQLLGDPEAAAQRFSDAPDELFISNPTRADQRADEGLALRRQQLDATKQTNTALEAAKIRKAEADATVAESKIAQQQEKVREGEVKAEKAEALKTEAAALAQELLNDEEGISDVYGTITGALPSVFQSSVDTERKIERLANLLTVENLGLMSGVLSESDIKLLQTAATNVADFRNSSSAATAELERIILKLTGKPAVRGNSQSGTIDRSGNSVTTQSGATIAFND